MLHAVYDFIIISWNGIPIPQDWIDGILVLLYKGKVEKSICDHYHVSARLLFNRLTEDICPYI